MDTVGIMAGADTDDLTTAGVDATADLDVEDTRDDVDVDDNAEDVEFVGSVALAADFWH